jgi:uncharacterized membrane protein YedE/YeeE
MNAIAAALFGLIFGLGLVISGMTDPNRILAFLDVAGDWDPSLALVMAGAIAVALPAYTLARGAKTAVLDGTSHLPDRKRPVTASLVVGAALFGVGWGLSGLCPGPAIVLLSTAQLKAFLFLGAVATGIWAVALIQAKTRRAPEAQPGKSAEAIQRPVGAPE